MATRRAATVKDIEMFDRFSILKEHNSKKKLLDCLKSDKRVELEESQFGDPGEDYSALLVSGKRVAYFPGY